MTDYAKLKSMVRVFKNYGIDHPSRVRKAGFEKDLGFDKVFVGGLIFDVEEALEIILDQDEVDRIENPNDLISFMMDKTSLS